MSIILSNLIAFMTVFLVDYYTKNKYCVFTVTLSCYCILLMSGNTFNADYKGYEYFYNYAIDYGELLYQNLTRIFYTLGFSYQEFKSISSIIFILWLTYLIYKMAPKNIRWLTMCLYIIFPFFYDVIVVRNFMGSVFLLQGICYLVSNRKHSVLLFLLFTLLACGFHSIFVIYIPFAFIPAIVRNLKMQVSLYLFIIVAAILAVTDSMLPIIIYILSYLGSMKIARFIFYINNRADWGVLLFLFFAFAPVLLIHPYYKFIKRRHRIQIASLHSDCNEYITKQKNLLITYVYYANFILLLYLPIIVLQSNFGRICTNICIPNSIVLLIAAFDRSYKYRLLTGLGIVLIYLLRIYGGIYVYKDVLNNNYFFS